MFILDLEKFMAKYLNDTFAIGAHSFYLQIICQHFSIEAATLAPISYLFHSIELNESKI